MRRVVARPRVQIFVLVAIFLMFGLIGGMYLTAGDLLAGDNLFGTILGCLLVPGAILGVWRALRVGIVIDEVGIRIRNLDSRDRVIPWARIESIECEQIGMRGVLPLFAPVIRPCDDADGFVVRPLGSYVRAHAERRTERLRTFMAGGTGS
ncbi:hypothetical protein [Actinoplanes sp. GCM10030250]|uniref:hypothetical protein n=1 Tax=Actinoplanes sp. GCM10030250 TaxID=3273376 RepID=UPI00360BE96D